MSEPISIAGQGVNNNGAVESISGTNTLTGNITLTGNASIGVDSGNLTQNTGAISDGASSFALTETGAGNLQLQGANSYKGGTTLSAGTLTLGNSSDLGTGPLTLTGGTLQASVSSFIVTNPLAFTANAAITIAGSNSLTFSSGFPITLLGTDTLTVTNTGGTTISDVLTGSGLTLAGSQTLTLTAANTYTGATTILGGTLSLSGANGELTGTSGISIYNTGTLQLE